MKKILFFVLIVALFFYSIEQNDVDEDDAVLELSLKNIWRGIKNSFKKTVNFLKNKGIYDRLVEILKNVGKNDAVKFCIEKGLDKSVCKESVDILEKNLK